MKRIYISLPITGHEDTYEQRLDNAVEYVKTNYPEYEYIITPKEIAERLEDYQPMKPKYKDYLIAMRYLCATDGMIAKGVLQR